MGSEKNRQWLLVSRPEGHFKSSDFQLREEAVPTPSEGEILIRNVYLSLDPASRGWADDQASYMPPVGLGEVMRGIGIGVVEESRHPDFLEGELVRGLLGWQDFALSNGRGLERLPYNPEIELTAYLAVLGHIGLTAYFGLLEVGRPEAGETLVVSAAAGAVGSLVGQIGKLKGCRVVGITGSEEKCRWLKEIGFDECIQYKSESVTERLPECCPDGIDIYFDNVGGAVLDAALGLINRKARVVLCGLISQYNAQETVPGPANFSNILIQSARMEGFIVMNFLDRAGPALKELALWLADGALVYRVDIVEGLENAPAAVNKLFDGSNQGKLIVRVSPEP